MDRNQLFRGIPEHGINCVSKYFQVRTFQQNEMIIAEGDEGSELFTIIEGSAVVKVGGKIVAYLNESDVFGELGILEGERRSASVFALDAMTLISINKKSFDSLCMSHAHIAMTMCKNLLTILAKKLVNANAIIREERRKSSPPPDIQTHHGLLSRLGTMLDIGKQHQPLA